MLLKTKGYPHLIDTPLVGKVTRAPVASQNGGILIAEDKIFLENLFNCDAVLTNIAKEKRIDFPSVYGIPSLEHLMDGDIILINTDGVINTLYRVESHQNFILITERCNSNCLMCSQPPRDRDDSYLMDVYDQLVPLIPKDCLELGLTGGEPTLLGRRFFELLEKIKKELPETELHCLTNGRSFAWKSVADRLESIKLSKLMLGIPLYSDYYQIHDYIVQAKNAFNQTMQGLYNLARNDQRIEIRIVLHKQSIPRLRKLAKYIYRNLPFVEHIAFMGLENQGYTPHNIQELWMDPVLYMDELREAANYLSDMGMNVSIYNSQLCTMPKDLWKFNRKSISDWKNIYLKECGSCAMSEECGGLFASCKNVHSAFLRPFETKVEY
jgi:His-Xaa-Ser system radical SAM maturase HxsC